MEAVWLVVWYVLFAFWLRYLPRQDKPNGQIRDFRVFVSALRFPGPTDI